MSKERRAYKSKLYVLTWPLCVLRGCLARSGLRDQLRRAAQSSTGSARLVGASVSEPHTSGFNEEFSLLYVGLIGLWTSYVVSKFVINISFRISYAARAHAQCHMPQRTRPAGPTNWPANDTDMLAPRGKGH